MRMITLHKKVMKDKKCTQSKNILKKLLKNVGKKNFYLELTLLKDLTTIMLKKEEL